MMVMRTSTGKVLVCEQKVAGLFLFVVLARLFHNIYVTLN